MHHNQPDQPSQLLVPEVLTTEEYYEAIQPKAPRGPLSSLYGMGDNDSSSSVIAQMGSPHSALRRRTDSIPGAVVDKQPRLSDDVLRIAIGELSVNRKDPQN